MSVAFNNTAAWRKATAYMSRFCKIGALPEQRRDLVSSGKDTRAEAAGSAERAKGAFGAGEAVDMTIPPKTAGNHFRRELFLFFQPSLTFIDFH
jgi:hypothetical protein